MRGAAGLYGTVLEDADSDPAGSVANTPLGSAVNSPAISRAASAEPDGPDASPDMDMGFDALDNGPATKTTKSISHSGSRSGTHTPSRPSLEHDRGAGHPGVPVGIPVGIPVGNGSGCTPDPFPTGL